MIKREGRGDYFASYVNSTWNWRLSLRKIFDWFKARRLSFSTAVWFSVFFHVLLLGYISLSQASSPDSRRKRPGRDSAVLNQALVEMQDEIVSSGGLDSLIPETLQDDIDELMRGMDLGRALSDKEKLELFKRLIEALLTLKQEKTFAAPDSEISLSDILSFLEKEGGWELDSGKKVFPDSGQGDWNSLFHSLTKERRDTLNFLRRYEGSEKDGTKIARGQVMVETESGIKYIPIEYYFRESPFEEILAQGTSLFYIMRGFPVVSVEDEKIEPVEQEEKQPAIHQEKGFSVIYLTGFTPTVQGFQEPNKTERNPFVFTGDKERQIQQILDGLMFFPEEDQFGYFSEKYLETFDPDSEDLAELTQEFIYNNLCNVIIVIDSISGAFDFIEELYFSKPLDFLFLDHWRKYPESNTGFEFLFSLASHYDFERRALEYMIGAYRDSKRLLNRMYSKSNVYNKQAKAYVIREIYEDLFFQLREMGYDNLEQAIERYRDEQVGIYEIVIDRGGELRNRALFALGRLYWDEGKYDLALEKWDSIGSGYASKSYQDVRIIKNTTKDRNELIRKIDGLFEWEIYKGSSQLLDRLLRYHKWKKREKADKAKV